MKRFNSFLKAYYFGYFSLLVNLITLGGFIVIFTKEAYAVIISLITLVLFLLVILIRFLLIVRTFLLFKSEDGLHKFATYVRYSTVDGNIVDYEIHKYIQCKTFMIDKVKHRYHWTGSKKPVISSDLQHVVKTVENQGSYDEIYLEFKKPLVYNDFCVTHVRMKIDDSDQHGKKYISIKITEPVQLLSFRIDLKHLVSYKNARVTKSKANLPYPPDELITDIPFDQSTRSYEYIINNPDFGYHYKIDWS